jgi:hypothetical protein
LAGSEGAVILEELKRYSKRKIRELLNHAIHVLIASTYGFVFQAMKNASGASFNLLAGARWGEL